MEELNENPKPYLSENFAPPIDITPQTYNAVIEKDLAFEGKKYNRRNTGFRGLIGLSELVRLARESFSRDPQRRRAARVRAGRAH